MTVLAHDITARDGTRLRLWEHPAEDTREAVLFVHGATYPGRAVFATAREGNDSWLASVARAGRGAYALDIRGYGDSERPAAMDEPASALSGDPPVRAAQAAEDVQDTLAVVGERSRRIHLVGYSWGTMVCGMLLAGADAPSVASLTQFAPVHRLPVARAARFDPGDPPRPTRTVTRAAVRERWDEQVPEGTTPAAVRGGNTGADPTFEAFWTALATSGQATDRGPAGGDRSGERPAETTIVAPNGTLVDLRASTDRALYDPARISVPTLVVRGSADPTAGREDALALYDALGTDEKEYVEVAGGTHFLPLERRRETLYDVVRTFQRRATDG